MDVQRRHQTDGAVYTLDSLDRVLSESEWHSGVSSRTDFTYIGLSDAVGQEQHYDGSGVLTETKSYVYDALGRPATLTDTPAGGATSRFSYVFDPHGSVELVLEQNRHVEAAYGYNAYGDTNLSLTKTATGFSPNTNAFQFQSERYDTGSKTIDFGARHYNPALERFTQRDSYQAALDNLGLSTDPLNGNRYALTGANPINFVDLDGHAASFGWFGMTAGKKSPGIKINTGCGGACASGIKINTGCGGACGSGIKINTGCGGSCSGFKEIYAPTCFGACGLSGIFDPIPTKPTVGEHLKNSSREGKGRTGASGGGSSQDDTLRGGNRLPDDRISSGPTKPGRAPIGDDGHPVELHHINQDQNGPVNEMTRTDHSTWRELRR